MKKWRDFKLLALCEGLVLLDAGCKPKDEWIENDVLFGFFATLVALVWQVWFGGVCDKHSRWQPALLGRSAPRTPHPDRAGPTST